LEEVTLYFISIFGTSMAIFAAIFPIDDSDLLYSRLTRVLIDFWGGGISFGLLFPALA
jgi:hypothetical protein